MHGFIVHELASDVTVRVTRIMPNLPPALDAEVARLWRLACIRVDAGGAGRMFNGRVFSIDRIDPDRIEGHLTEYRRLVAQIEDHNLFPALGIRSLSACGVLRCAGGVPIGRRPAAAIYQPGMWQLAPAGSVDSSAIGLDGRANLAAQVLRELEEELGLNATDIDRTIPLCVVEHPGSHVYDCGIAMTTTLDADAVLTAHQTRGNGEYGELRIVPESDLPTFVAQAGDQLVPPAREYLFRLGLLDQGLSPPTGL
jgi:8-oxo-dGTP pyrophosphatase MutT (NUDIX family)